MSTFIGTYIDSLNPGWKLDDWLSWPPDIFALTSLLLKRTGAYRYTVHPPHMWPEIEDWKGRLEETKNEWYDWILGERHDLPPLILACKERLVSSWNIKIEDVRSMTAGENPDQAAWNLCRSILELHALADEACAGFGTPSSPRYAGRDNSPIKAIHCIANILLANSGSLSRLPKYVAQVLPKFRTPSVGQTLRSLSHYVTVHQTEVEVLWRAMPWANIDENTINILVVPWPYEMKSTWFSPSPYSTPRKSIDRDRYFVYTGHQENFDAENLLALIASAEESVNRVHMVVFPELALTESNLKDLLHALEKKKDRDKIPMVIAGVGSDHARELGNNTVILSTFFAGRWYQMKQDKHHRWKLDGNQIRQYNLGGVLTGSKDWWEAIEIPPRVLSVLAPNNWLTLCPLICEDLARLEPVSEIIRGVGPTLLIAILQDGPQLRERWPGRYVSVLADDPGSSILTVSSAGLAKRSSPLLDGKVSRKPIALWKDQISGWKEIDIEDGKEAVVLTISAQWKEEFTSDGRSDHNSAAVFVLQGTHPVGTGTNHHAQSRNTVEATPDSFVDTGNQDGHHRFSDQFDIREITVFSYFVDAVVDFNASYVDEITCWILGDETGGVLLKNLRPKDDLWHLIHGQQSVDEILEGREEKDEHHHGFQPFVLWFGQLIKIIQRESNHRHSLEYLKRVTEYATKILDRIMEDSFVDEVFQSSDPFAALRADMMLPPMLPEISPKHRKVRVCIYCCLAMLWAVHNRLSGLRQKGQLNLEGARLLAEIENHLKRDYDKQWHRAIKKSEDHESRHLQTTAMEAQ